GHWFSDDLPDLDSKDSKQHLCGKWLVAIDEMAALLKTRADAATIKSYITRRVEKYRRPFDRLDVTEPRPCVFTCTTNESVYLRDETGGRRFWPVVVSDVRLDNLRRDRDQLLAEAVHAYNQHEPWWPSREVEALLIAPEQEKRFDADPWHDMIAA